jgi:hypothetical protein
VPWILALPPVPEENENAFLRASKTVIQTGVKNERNGKTPYYFRATSSIFPPRNQVVVLPKSLTISVSYAIFVPG